MAAPNDNSRFLVRTEDMTFLGREVRGEGGNGLFIDDGEKVKSSLAEAYKQQPAQFQRQEDWTHWVSSNPIMLSDGDSDDEVRTKLSRVQPQPNFARPDIMYSWGDHVADAWRAFVKIQNKDQLARDECQAILRMLMHGIRNVVAMLPKPIFIHGKKIWANGDGHEPNPFLSPGVDQVNCTATLGFSSITKARQFFQHKRFIVGLIHDKASEHWVGFIFDRLQQHGMYFDTMESGRENRLRRSAIATREMFARLGLPHNFDVFGMPVSSQPTDWECGPLACWLLASALRDLVGVSGRDLINMIELTLITMDGHKTRPIINIDIRHQDWLYAPWRNPARLAERKTKSLQSITASLSVMLMNEIGIRSGVYWKVKEDDMLMDATIEHIQMIRVAGLDQKTFPLEKLFTDRGGLHFMGPMHAPGSSNFREHWVIPYPSSVLRQDGNGMKTEYHTFRADQ